MELSAGEKVVGIKQVRRALEQHTARYVFLARDADSSLTAPLAALCRRQDVPLDDSMTMQQLGRTCQIAVSAAAAALIVRAE